MQLDGLLQLWSRYDAADRAQEWGLQQHFSHAGQGSCKLRAKSRDTAAMQMADTLLRRAGLGHWAKVHRGHAPVELELAELWRP